MQQISAAELPIQQLYSFIRDSSCCRHKRNYRRSEKDDQIIVDGIEGKVIINPTEEEIKVYEEKQAAFAKQQAEWAKLKDEPTFSADGEQVELAANIGTPDDVEGVLNNGGEGVGLYRTEFLYMGNSELPSEDVQFEAYKTVLEKWETSLSL